MLEKIKIHSTQSPPISVKPFRASAIVLLWAIAGVAAAVGSIVFPFSFLLYRGCGITRWAEAPGSAAVAADHGPALLPVAARTRRASCARAPSTRFPPPHSSP